MIEKLELTEVKADSLKSNPWNPNVMNSELYESLVSGIKKEGFLQPILARKEDGLIIDGEHRWKAAKEAGLKKIAAQFIKCSEIEAKKLTLAFNNRRGEHEIEKLEAILTELAKSDGELNRFELGYLEDDITRIINECEDIAIALGAKSEGKSFSEKELDENLNTDSECPSCGYKW
jgi:ParB family chromosome partitioning protein